MKIEKMCQDRSQEAVLTIRRLIKGAGRVLDLPMPTPRPLLGTMTVGGIMGYRSRSNHVRIAHMSCMSDTCRVFELTFQ